MDNISHSFAGLAVGELLHRSLPAEADGSQQCLRRRLLLLSCWLASNFPDLDLLLTPLLPKPLGYLLHHRGHTHTLLYALPQAFLLWALLWALWPAARALLRTSRTARRALALSLAIGFGLHLAMDYLNNYGIHPFHPFDSHWYYGDMVFIVEPAFWVTLGIPFAFTLGRRWLRWPLVAALLAAPTYFALRAYLALGSLAALWAIAIVLTVLAVRASAGSRRSLAAGVLAAVAFVALQAAASHRARQLVRHDLREQDADATLRDISLTPFPTNPLCWTFVSLETDAGDDSYRLQRGQLSLAPAIVPVAACPARLSEIDDADEALAANPAILYVSEDSGSLRWLQALWAGNCHFAAWMRFARMPLLEDTRASDIRFASTPRGNFTTMHLKDFNDSKCSPYIPQWDMPRADLLPPAAAGAP